MRAVASIKLLNCKGLNNAAIVMGLRIYVNAKPIYPFQMPLYQSSARKQQNIRIFNSEIF